MGLIGNAEPDRAAALWRAAAEVPARGARGMAPIQPPERQRARIDSHFDPLPIWYPPFEQARVSTPRRLPAARDHPAADGDVPFLGLAERLAAADLRRTIGSIMHRGTAASARPRRRRLGLGDRASNGRVKCAGAADGRASTRTRCGPGTRSASARGAWNLADDAPEVAHGLPAQPRDLRVPAGRRRQLATPIRSPARPRGTTCACGWRKRRPRTEGDDARRISLLLGHCRRHCRARRAILRSPLPPRPE